MVSTCIVSVCKNLGQVWFYIWYKNDNLRISFKIRKPTSYL